jgi:hypothetical protein
MKIMVNKTILPFVSYECETLYYTLRGEHKLLFGKKDVQENIWSLEGFMALCLVKCRDNFTFTLRSVKKVRNLGYYILITLMRFIQVPGIGSIVKCRGM